MSRTTLSVAQLVALLLESLLNGAFFTLFVILILLLSNSTSSSRFHRIVFALVACLMMSLSTAHLAMTFVRAVQAFVPSGPGQLANPDYYYLSLESPLELARACVFIAQTLLGDGVMIWRCYSVFDKSKIVLLLSWVPLIVNLVFGILGTIGLTQDGVPLSQQSRFYLSAFTFTTFIINLSCSWAVVHRIWRSSREMRDLSKVFPVLGALIQSGALYGAGTLALFITCVVRSDGVYAALVVIVPLVGIVFSLIVLQIYFHLHLSSLSHPNFATGQTSNLHTLGTLPRWQHYLSSSTEHQRQQGTVSIAPDPRLQSQRLSICSREDQADQESLSSNADVRLKEMPLEH